MAKKKVEKHKDEKAETPNFTLKCKACGTVFKSNESCACPKCKTYEGQILAVNGETLEDIEHTKNKVPSFDITKDVKQPDKVKCLGCGKLLDKPCPTCDNPLCGECFKRVGEDASFLEEIRKKLFA